MRCVVCLERPAQLFLCRPCGRSLNRVKFNHGDLIEWAARRARYFERRRKKETPTP